MGNIEHNKKSIIIKKLRRDYARKNQQTVNLLWVNEVFETDKGKRKVVLDDTHVIKAISKDEADYLVKCLRSIGVKATIDKAIPPNKKSLLVDKKGKLIWVKS